MVEDLSKTPGGRQPTAQLGQNIGEAIASSKQLANQVNRIRRDVGLEEETFSFNDLSETQEKLTPEARKRMDFEDTLSAYRQAAESLVLFLRELSRGYGEAKLEEGDS